MGVGKISDKSVLSHINTTTNSTMSLQYPTKPQKAALSQKKTKKSKKKAKGKKATRLE